MKKTAAKPSVEDVVAKYKIDGKEEKLLFEKARFNDFLLEVKPFIEVLGDLYRKTRKP